MPSLDPARSPSQLAGASSSGRSNMRSPGAEPIDDVPAGEAGAPALGGRGPVPRPGGESHGGLPERKGTHDRGSVGLLRDAGGVRELGLTRANPSPDPPSPAGRAGKEPGTRIRPHRLVNGKLVDGKLVDGERRAVRARI